MYCKKCGTDNPNDSRFCIACGEVLNTDNEVANHVKSTVKFDKLMILKIVTIIMSAFCIISPFCTWANVPLYDNIYSYFGGSGSVSSYSLFSYATTVSNSAELFSLPILILLLIAVFSMVMNLIYIIKILMKKQKCFKFALLGNIALLVSSVFFTIFIMLTSAVTMNAFSMTAIPYITISICIANIVLTNISRKKQ